MLCYVMLCYVMLCYVMLCYVMLCYVMLNTVLSVTYVYMMKLGYELIMHLINIVLCTKIT